MFGLIKKVITLPVDVVKDVVTLGGALDDKDETYTGKKLKKIAKKIKKL